MPGGLTLTAVTWFSKSSTITVKGGHHIDRCFKLASRHLFSLKALGNELVCI